jgi:hypothetical protein
VVPGSGWVPSSQSRVVADSLSTHVHPRVWTWTLTPLAPVRNPPWKSSLSTRRVATGFVRISAHLCHELLVGVWAATLERAPP